MSSKNDSANTFMLGWRLMKLLTASAKISMTITARIIAVIMIGMCGTMPTAVITESSEKTMSSAKI